MMAILVRKKVRKNNHCNENQPLCLTHPKNKESLKGSL